MRNRYEKYKDSGIEWIGEVPEHWGVKKQKYLLSKLIGGGTPDSNDDSNWTDGDEGIPWVNIGDMFNKEFVNATKSRITHKGLKEKNLTVLPKGTLLYSIYATLGRVSELKIQATTNQAILGLIPNSVISKYFLKWFLLSMEQYVQEHASVNTQNNLNAMKVRNFFIPLPLFDEQTLISKYLDKKTSEIDSLIADKERLIQCLQEYKQSVITEAVTKGLNPDVKMKDSGVEWIGEVPEHWELKKLKYLGCCQNGISKGADYFGKGHPFVSYGDAYKNMELPLAVEGLANSSTNDRKIYSVCEGDVFFTRTSETIEETGIASICMKTIDNATFSGFLIRFRPTSKEINKIFYKYYFRNQILRAYFVKEMNLVTRASLSQALLKSLPVIVPSNMEQKQIANYLDEKCNEIDALMKYTRIHIQKIKEYRQSLIYEAVTGKIDVRDYNPEKHQPERSEKLA